MKDTNSNECIGKRSAECLNEPHDWRFEEEDRGVMLIEEYFGRRRDGIVSKTVECTSRRRY